MNKYFGVVEFLGSEERESRTTSVMDFELTAEWLRVTEETYRDVIMSGQYDGYEIVVLVYEYCGDEGKFGPVVGWDVDSEKVLVRKEFMNPYAV